MSAGLPESPAAMADLYRDLVALRAPIASWERGASPAAQLADAPTAVRPALMIGPGAVAFDPDFYEAANGDVRAVGVDPWIHFQLHGVHELRDPHPAIASQWLARFIPARPDVGVVDQYLVDPRYWLVRPAPGIDIEGYATSGRWSGSRHPLLEALEQGVLADWVADPGLASDSPQQREVREALLLMSGRHPGLRPELDQLVRPSRFHQQPPYRVFPGVGVANGRGTMTVLDAAGPPRDDVVLLRDRSLSWTSPQEVAASQALVLAPDTCPSLEELRALPEAALVVPGDLLTERALRVAITVLAAPVKLWPFDTAVRLRAESLTIRTRSAWKDAVRRRLPVHRSADRGRSAASGVTITRNPAPDDPLQTGLDGLLLLLSAGSRTPIHVSEDLAHARPLLQALVKEAR